MTDYTSIADSQVEPLSPVTSELMTALRDNPLAIAEGSIGAPRMVLKSIERLVAGDTIRSQRSLLLANGEVITHSFAFIQIGTIRCTTSGTGGGGTWLVSRTRNGTSTTVASGSGVTSSTDVSVIPGDSVLIQYTNGSVGQTPTCAFSTNGANLWPGSAERLEGNDV